jgi:hypothetical protein
MIHNPIVKHKSIVGYYFKSATSDDINVVRMKDSKKEFVGTVSDLRQITFIKEQIKMIRKKNVTKEMWNNIIRLSQLTDKDGKLLFVDDYVKLIEFVGTIGKVISFNKSRTKVFVQYCHQADGLYVDKFIDPKLLKLVMVASISMEADVLYESNNRKKEYIIKRKRIFSKEQDEPFLRNLKLMEKISGHDFEIIKFNNGMDSKLWLEVPVHISKYELVVHKDYVESVFVPQNKTYDKWQSK